MGDKVAILKGVTDTPYTRPSDWLSLSDIPEGTEKISMLVAIFDCQTNFLAVVLNGNYTIDWGDGSVPQNINSGVKAQHNYVYSDISPSTYCTRGYRQAIITITPQGGQNLTYASFDEMHSSDTVRHSTPILYMKTRVPEMTQLRFYGNNICYSQMMEEFEWQGTSKLSTGATMFYSCYGLIKCKVIFSASVTSLYLCFSGCYSLRELNMTGITSAITDTRSMFGNCVSITTVPLFDTSNVTTASNMFAFCTSLREIPEFNFSNCTDFSFMFYWCSSLIRTGLIDIRKATTTTYMFGNCYSLLSGNVYAPSAPNLADTNRMFSSCARMITVNLFDTSHVTNISFMLYYCLALRKVPAFDFSATINASSAFAYCFALEECADLNLPVSTNTSYMFYGCYSLLTYPVRDLPLSTTCEWMYAYCYNAKDSRDFNIPSATNLIYMFYQNLTNSIFGTFTLNTVGDITANNMFQHCWTVKKIAQFTATKILTTTSMFEYDSGLSIAVFNDIQVSFSLASCNFGRDELVDIFNGLKDLTGGDSQTLTITGNWGVSSLSDEDKAIATNKNWTLVL